MIAGRCRPRCLPAGCRNERSRSRRRRSAVRAGRSGQGHHQPVQPADQGHPRAGDEETPRRDADIPGRRAEAGDRRHRSWLVHPHADLRQGATRQGGGGKDRGADDCARRTGAGSQRQSADRNHEARQPSGRHRRVRATADEAGCGQDEARRHLGGARPGPRSGQSRHHHPHRRRRRRRRRHADRRHR